MLLSFLAQTLNFGFQVRRNLRPVHNPAQTQRPRPAAHAIRVSLRYFTFLERRKTRGRAFPTAGVDTRMNSRRGTHLLRAGRKKSGGFGIGFGGGWDGGGESRPFRRLDLDKASSCRTNGLGFRCRLEGRLSMRHGAIKAGGRRAFSRSPPESGSVAGRGGRWVRAGRRAWR
jgi:hypothetical protein